MKYIFIIFSVFYIKSAFAEFNVKDFFKPYIGVDFGLNIVDYKYQTDLDDIFYSITVNTGIKSGKYFGFELFFTQSSTNNLEYISDTQAHNHEYYYQAFGFDVFGYYNIFQHTDFFTTVGIANYKTYNKHNCVGYINNSDTTYENNTTARFGIGFMYIFPYNKVSGLIQYHYTPIKNKLIDTISEFSIGIRYSF